MPISAEQWRAGVGLNNASFMRHQSQAGDYIIDQNMSVLLSLWIWLAIRSKGVILIGGMCWYTYIATCHRATVNKCTKFYWVDSSPLSPLASYTITSNKESKTFIIQPASCTNMMHAWQRS